MEPLQVLKAGTEIAPPKLPVPCSTNEPPTPPSQNFHVNCGDTLTADASPLLSVTLMLVSYALPLCTPRALKVPVTKLPRGESERLNGFEGNTKHVTRNSD